MSEVEDISIKQEAKRERIISIAKIEHNKVCRCDHKYLMSCNKMAQAILNVKL